MLLFEFLLNLTGINFHFKKVNLHQFLSLLNPLGGDQSLVV